jgi:hypothetical protein
MMYNETVYEDVSIDFAEDDSNHTATKVRVHFASSSG